jgi:uncharacterized protein (TIGR03435 family)
MRAYGARADQVTGPNWTETERYDVVATMAPSTPKEQIPQLVQALLAERFKLVLHRDNKLVQTSGGPRLTQADGDSHSIKAYVSYVDSGIRGKGPLPTLAYYLSSFVRDLENGPPPLWNPVKNKPRLLPRQFLM